MKLEVVSGKKMAPTEHVKQNLFLLLVVGCCTIRFVLLLHLSTLKENSSHCPLHNI